MSEGERGTQRNGVWDVNAEAREASRCGFKVQSDHEQAWDVSSTVLLRCRVTVRRGGRSPCESETRRPGELTTPSVVSAGL